MIIKEDLKEAKERMSAWWDHEIIDRPVIAYHIPEGPGSDKALIGSSPINFELAKNWDGIETLLDTFEENSSGLIYGGECIPTYCPNFGPGIMAAVLGVTPEYKSGTVWFHRPTDLKDIISVLESARLNDNNEWYMRLKRTTEITAKRGAKFGYWVSMLDLGGILDILATFLKPTTIILTMKRNPELIDTCRRIILDKYMKVYDDLQTIINRHVDGCNTGLNLWCPKRYHVIQCDFSALLNPKYFERFVLPDLKEQAEQLDYSLYHLDGPEQIKYLDELLKIFDAIQWVPGLKPGVPQDGTDEWMPLYKKIQKAGKNIQMTTFDWPLVPHIYKKLDPKGLAVYTVYFSSKVAECYLPEFLGGDGGKFVEGVVSWAKEKNIEKITRAKIREFAEEKKLEISKDFERTVFREVRKKPSEFLNYFSRSD